MRDRIEAFIGALAFEKGYSDSTCRAYRSDLEEFSEYLESLRPENEVTPMLPGGVDGRMIRGYLGYLHRKNKKSTISRKLAAVRSFFRFLIKREEIQADPTDQVATPKQEKPIPEYLSVDDMFRLLESIETDTLLGRRNKAMFETLYSGGIRISELVGLSLFDVDYSRELIRVRGKGDRERIVPVGPKALESILRYRKTLQTEEKISMETDGPLFLNKDLGRLSARSVRRILEKLTRECGPLVSISPHGVRHSYASHMLDSGADLRSLQELLGHKNLSTTQKYTHVSIEKLMETYDKAHPRK